MRKHLFAIAIFSALTFGALTASAQGKECHEGCHFGHELGLSQDQISKIKDIKLQEDKKTLQIHNQIKEKEAHLKTLRTADNADMNQINSTLEEIGKLKTEKRKIEEANHQEIRKILNDEQRIKFDKFSSHRHGMHGKGHGGYHGNHHGHDGHNGGHGHEGHHGNHKGGHNGHGGHDGNHHSDCCKEHQNAKGGK